MSHTISVATSIPTQQPIAEPRALEVPTFLQTAGKATQLFFAGLAALAGVASFCVGISFTPFSPNGGIAAFGIGTSLFGLAGILLYAALAPQAPSLSSRQITSHS